MNQLPGCGCVGSMCVGREVTLINNFWSGKFLWEVSHTLSSQIAGARKRQNSSVSASPCLKFSRHKRRKINMAVKSLTGKYIATTWETLRLPFTGMGPHGASHGPYCGNSRSRLLLSLSLMDLFLSLFHFFSSSLPSVNLPPLLHFFLSFFLS